MNAEPLLGGRYKILKPLGSGGMSQTFLAIDLQRPGTPHCVVKQLKPMSNNPELLPSFKILFNREAESLEKLGRHDQIPRCSSR